MHFGETEREKERVSFSGEIIKFTIIKRERARKERGPKGGKRRRKGTQQVPQQYGQSQALASSGNLSSSSFFLFILSQLSP